MRTFLGSSMCLQDITVLDGFNFYLTAFFQNPKREEVTKVKEY